MAKSTVSATARKAAKPRKSLRQATRPLPHPDFPLWNHASGRWAKKIRGQLKYFGKVSDDTDGQKALALWLEQKDSLLAGRTPQAKRDGLTIEDLCDHFLTEKDNRLTAGEIAARTYAEYKATCARLGAEFGFARYVDDLTPADFTKLRKGIADQWGPIRLGNEIQRVRSVFKHGYDLGLIDRPLRFGPGFKRPSAKVLRLERAKKGPRMFEAGELGKILAAAGVPLKAMILLGINCGFGNADVGLLPQSALDLDGGWVRFPRPKTGVERRCPLWPETVEALKAAIAERPEPKGETRSDLVFVTKYGKCWHKETPDNPISCEFRKLLDVLSMHRPGLGFYALRHTTETIGGETKDQVAVNSIMGHVDASMAGAYRERIDDGRLKAVADHVRGYLFPTAGMAAGEGGGK